MTKDEFVQTLGDLLACLPQDQIRESQEFYAEVIADRMEDGMSEEEAVAAMGAPGAVAEAILNDLPVVPRAIAKTKRRSTALLWVLAIVGSPVWVPLLLAFVAVALCVYACIWILALCVWIVAAACLVAVPLLTVLAVDGGLIGNAAFAITMAGCSLGFLGAALLVGVAAWEVSKQIARLSALWVKKVLSPFKKDDGRGRGRGSDGSSEGSSAGLRHIAQSAASIEVSDEQTALLAAAN